MSDYNIRTKIHDSGLNMINSLGTDIAKKIETVDGSNQVDLLKLQSEVQSYNNTISMMSTIMKGLADTDKEVIRSM